DSTQHAKAPNSRLQIPKKLPVLSSNRMAGPASWGVGVWDFSGAWCLGFGISLDVHSWFRSLRSGIRAGPGFYNASQHLPHPGILGINAERGPEVSFGLVQVLFFDADHAESHVSLVIIRMGAKLRLKLLPRLRELPFLEKDQTQIIMGFGLAGIELQSGPKMPCGGCRLPQRAQ